MSCSPTFELRFSNNIHLHDTEKAKYIKLMKKFINDYNKDIDNDCKSITIFPVSRLGFSGAKVFYVYVYKISDEDPDVKIAKFDKYKDIKKEAKKAKKFSHDTYGPYGEDDYYNNQGLLIYKEVPDGKEFLNIMKDEDDIAFCCKVISNLYKPYTKKLLKYGIKETGRKKILKDYDRYLKRKNKPIEKAKVLTEYFNGEGEKLISFYKRLNKEPKFINKVRVHGDLHARNIMANDKGSYLIDFDWVHRGHVAKDFSLLESTIMYMILPNLIINKSKKDKDSGYITSEEMLNFHKQLYKNFVPKKFKNISQDQNKNNCFAKAFYVIKEIRRYAQKVMTKFYNKKDFTNEFEEYKYSLVIIGLSQISFPDTSLEILVNTTDYIIETM